jgi:hypothetical protein
VIVSPRTDEPVPGSTPAPGPAFNLPDAAAPGAQDAAPASPPVGGQACAEEDHKAQPTPLDLLLLVDNSQAGQLCHSAFLIWLPSVVTDIALV